MSGRAFRSLVRGRMEARREDYGTARRAVVAAGTAPPAPPAGACCENERRSLAGGCTSCGDPCL